MIAVLGASGHTGKKIAEALLAAGETVRAIGRSEVKLAGLKRAGADTLIGDVIDASFLTNAFRGADAVYTLLPADKQSSDYRGRQDMEGEATARAIRTSGVRRIVFLSSLGAELSEGTGLIAGLHAQEERLTRLDGTHVLFLRPGLFFENFYDSLGLIKQQGIVGDSVAADVAIPMVATRDIADAATKALTARGWRGVVVRELLGPRDMTYNEAVRLLGMRIGKPDLQYLQFSYDDMAQALVQTGLSESFAGLYTGLTRAINEQTIKSGQGRTPDNTTATRFEDFVSELVWAYHDA